MPLARWAKAMMAVQAMVALSTAGARNRKGSERFGLTGQPENRSTFAVMGITTSQLTPVEQTAFLTEYARALDSRWSRPILGDSLADEVVGKISTTSRASGCRRVSYAKPHCAPRCSTTGCARSSGTMRMRSSWIWVADWTAASTASGHLRRWTGTTWTCPVSPRLRNEVLPPNPHSHALAVSLTNGHWPDTIPADRPTMLIADGLFAFLSEPVIVGIFDRITDHFRSGELAFNDYGRIGWFSRIAVKLYPQKMFKDVGSQWGYLGFNDAYHPEAWNPRMRLVEEASLPPARPRSSSFRRGSASRPD